MKTIIGIGSAGCNIADKFSSYPQYKTYKIDTNLKKAPRCYNFPEYDCPEDYEAKCPSLKSFFKNIKGDVLFITSCGLISAASLKILEQIKHKCDISVLYVQPDRALLSEIKLLNDNVIFHVLQEYARSDLFKRAYLVSNVELSKIIGDVPLREYYDRLNDLVVSTIHMVNVFDNSDSEINTFTHSVDSAKISTFSIVDYEKDEEKVFFNLDIPRDKRYYYAIPERALETDKKLLKNITRQLKNLKRNDKIKVTYGIFSTTYDDTYVYGMLNSSVVQNNKFRLDKELDL